MSITKLPPQRNASSISIIILLLLKAHQFCDDGRPESQEVRRRELDEKNSESQQHLRADGWIAKELEILRQLLYGRKEKQQLRYSNIPLSQTK